MRQKDSIRRSIIFIRGDSSLFRWWFGVCGDFRLQQGSFGRFPSKQRRAEWLLEHGERGYRGLAPKVGDGGDGGDASMKFDVGETRRDASKSALAPSSLGPPHFVAARLPRIAINHTFRTAKATGDGVAMIVDAVQAKDGARRMNLPSDK